MKDVIPNINSSLYETDQNPVPEGVRSGFIETPDGVRLRYARWESEKRPSKGTVVILSGRTEFIEKYFETVTDLRIRGFGVLCFDWRGQGGSDRLLKDPLKGHVEHFDEYLIDLETILTEVALPDCRSPLYILAHSTGSLVALLAAPALGNRVRRMVLLATLLELDRTPIRQGTLAPVLGFLSFVGLGRSLVASRRPSMESHPFVLNKLTSDMKRFHRNRKVVELNRRLSIGSPTISWLFASFRAMAQVVRPGYSDAISIPTLFINAGGDEVVKTAVTEVFSRRMRAASFLTISGSRHELLQERDEYREQVLAAFDAFIPGTDA